MFPKQCTKAEVLHRSCVIYNPLVLVSVLKEITAHLHISIDEEHMAQHIEDMQKYEM